MLYRGIDDIKMGVAETFVLSIVEASRGFNLRLPNTRLAKAELAEGSVLHIRSG